MVPQAIMLCVREGSLREHHGLALLVHGNKHGHAAIVTPPLCVWA